jgi:hypothetical protein
MAKILKGLGIRSIFGNTQKKIAMKIQELNKKKLPIVKIDKALEKFKDKILFKDKLDNANQILKTVGLPKK